MEQVESVRSGSSGTSTRRKRRNHKQRPESIIVYRSDPERAAGEEDHGGDSEGGERNSEQGAKFLNNPSSEGEACNLMQSSKKRSWPKMNAEGLYCHCTAL